MSQAASLCPIPHQSNSPVAAQCPVPPAAPPTERPAECPIAHEQPAESSPLNPLNNIPTLAQSRAEMQRADLPTSRTASSIPRGDAVAAGAAVWEYPSPQQFYNALVRKGWETPEEHVETMVEIHNFLNEQAWNEVLKWEQRRDRYGLLHNLLTLFIEVNCILQCCKG